MLLILLACTKAPEDDSPAPTESRTADSPADSADTACTPVKWYTDWDQDGWGSEVSCTESCWGPPGSVPTTGDCDDADAAVNPDVVEVCGNSKDDDCADGDAVCG